MSKLIYVDRLKKDILALQDCHNGFSDTYDKACIIGVIDEQPTIEERKWIPCSERLPEDSQFVLMTIRRMDEHYNHEPFISVGYISWNQSAWWCAHDGNCKSNDIRVDAWMPLPEGYKGDKDGE